MTTAVQLENMEVEVSPVLAIQLDRRCPSDADAIGATIGEAVEALVQCLKRNALRPVAPPRVIYDAYDEGGTRMRVAFPVAAAPAVLVDAGAVRVLSIRGGRALRFVHRGPYAGLAETYERIAEWLRERGHWHGPEDWRRYHPIWEEYLGDPVTSRPEQLVTRIYLSLE